VGTLEDPADDPSEEPTAQQVNRHRRRVVIEWIIIVVVAVLASILVRTFVFETYYIPSASMEPTLLIGDRIIVNKLAVDFGTIHTGDIIVFKAPPAENCGTKVDDLVKRVIGVPGDHLTSKGNTIYINGKPLKITYPDSCDSRFWGTVPRSDIIGKVFLRIWPFSRIGFL
jgi:signal peptidase I